MKASRTPARKKAKARAAKLPKAAPRPKREAKPALATKRRKVALRPKQKAKPTALAELDANGPIDAQVAWVLGWLERHGTATTRDGMPGYGIIAERAFGVTMADLKVLGALVGRQHALARALWDTGWYEARMLTAFVADPAQLSPAQMDAWCRDFDNWAVCDTLCFHLFDRSEHAFEKVAAWASRREEFVKRAAFALLAALALHDAATEDAPFLETLVLVERASTDERNFVKKGVSWALRAIGGRSAELNVACLGLGEQLSASSDPSARWVGKDALKDLSRPVVRARAARRTAARAKPGKVARKSGKVARKKPDRAL